MGQITSNNITNQKYGVSYSENNFGLFHIYKV